MKSRQNPSSIGDRILSRSEMRGRDLAPINPSKASYLRNRLTVTDGWLEESKKINDAIQSYEKMNDTKGSDPERFIQHYFDRDQKDYSKTIKEKYVSNNNSQELAITLFYILG